MRLLDVVVVHAGIVFDSCLELLDVVLCVLEVLLRVVSVTVLKFALEL